MRFRRILSGLGLGLFLGAGLMLAGCADGPAKVDAGLSSDTGQTIFAISCGTVKVLSDGYDAYVASHPDKISDKAQSYIALAKAALVADDGVSNICAAPYPTDVASLTTKVGSALLNVYRAYSEQGIDPRVTIAAAEQTAEAPPATQ